MLQFIACSVPGDVAFIDEFLYEDVDERDGKHNCVGECQDNEIFAQDGEDFMSEEIACGAVRDEESADSEHCQAEPEKCVETDEGRCSGDGIRVI